MKSGMKNYNTTGHEGVTETWNIIQNDFGCCGVTDYKDWKTGSDLKNGNFFPKVDFRIFLKLVLCFRQCT